MSSQASYEFPQKQMQSLHLAQPNPLSNSTGCGTDWLLKMTWRSWWITGCDASEQCTLTVMKAY